MSVRYLKYLSVLESARWRKLKWRRLQVARFKCEDCDWEFFGRSPKSALKFFELHHITYVRVGSEHLEDVRILCPTCHRKRHGKEIAA